MRSRSAPPGQGRHPQYRRVLVKSQASVTILRMTGDQARFLREKLGLSVKDFALALGVSWGAVYHWEAGRSRPGGRGLKKLRILWAKHVQGPESYEEAEALVAAVLDVPEGIAAQLLGRHQRADGETWAQAVDRVVTLEERRRSSMLAG